MAGYRPPYTDSEERKILKFIIDEQAFYNLRGDLFWKDLERTGTLERTWQSLKNHFKKHLVHKLHYPVYGLEESELNAIRMGYGQTKKTFKVGNRNPNRRRDEENEETETNQQPSTSEQPTTSAQSTANSGRKKINMKPPLDFFTMKWSDEEDNT